MAKTPWTTLTALFGIALGVASTVAVHLVSLAVSDSLRAAHPPHLRGVTHIAVQPGAGMDDYFALRRLWRSQQRPQGLDWPGGGRPKAQEGAPSAGNRVGGKRQGTLLSRPAQQGVPAANTGAEGNRPEASSLPPTQEGLPDADLSGQSGQPRGGDLPTAPAGLPDAGSGALGWLRDLEFMAPVVEGQLLADGRRYQVVGADWLGGAAPPNIGVMGRALAADRSLGLAADAVLELHGEPWGVAAVLDSGVNNGLFLDIGDALRLLRRSADDLSFVALRLRDPWAGPRTWLEPLLPGLSAGLPTTAAGATAAANRAQGVETARAGTGSTCAILSGPPATDPPADSAAPKSSCAATTAASPGLADWRLRPVAGILPEQQFAKSILFNLGALGMLALLVAWFLIYQVCVVWLRRQEAVMLRLQAIGCGRGELAGGFLLSTALLSALATAAGICGGYALAALLVRVSTAGLSAIPAVEMSTVVAAKGLISGLGVALAGAWLAFARGAPSADASAARPKAVPAPGTAAQASRGSLAGRRPVAALRQRLGGPPWPTIGLGATLIAIGLGFEEAGLLGGFTAILAACLIAAAMVTPLLGFLRRRLLWVRGNLLTRLALREATWHERDLSAALGALILAVGASIGVGLMVDSFERDFVRMLGQRMAHDFFLQLPNQEGKRLAATLQSAHPNLRVQAYGRIPYRILGQTTEVGHTDFSAAEAARYGHPRALAKDEALASELFLRKTSLRKGDEIEWAGDRLRIVHAFPDFGEATPRLLMNDAAAARQFGALGHDRLSLAGINAAALERLLREWASGVEVYQRTALRTTALDVFDRTFAITRALTMLTLLVAVIGLYNAMTALRLNQKASRPLLSALGLSAAEQRRLALVRGGVLGACATLLALPLGLFIGLALCSHINPRAFGWSLSLSISAEAWAWPVLLGLAAALVGNLAPTPGESEGAA